MEQMGKPHYERDQISGGVVIVAITALLGVLRSDQFRRERPEQKLQLGVGWCAAAE